MLRLETALPVQHRVCGLLGCVASLGVVSQLGYVFSNHMLPHSLISLSITSASSACRVSTVTSVISVTSVTSVPCVMVCAREYCGLQVMVGNYHRRGDEDLSLGKSCPSGLGRTPWSLWSRTGPRHVLVVSWWSAVGGRWKICLEANRRARLGGA